MTPMLAVRRALPSLAFAGLYFVCVQVGYAFYFPGSDGATLWPASGLFLAVLLLSEPRRWPERVLAVAIVHIGADTMLHHTPVPVSLLFTTADVLEAVLGAWLIRRFIGTRIQLTRLDESIGLALVTGLITTPLSAFLGAAAIHFGLHAAPYWTAYQTWWFGDALGVLLVAPAILSMSSAHELKALPIRRRLEGVLLVLVALVVSQLVFGTRTRVHDFDFPYVAIFALLWAAVRFGPLGASWLTLLLATVAVLNARMGRGPFLNVGTTPHDHVLELQTFLAIAYGSQIVAALTAENRKAMRSLEQSEAQYRSLVAVSPVAIFRADVAGNIVYVNDRWQALTGITGPEVYGRPWDTVIEASDRERLLHSNGGGGAAQALVELRILARDGRTSWVLGSLVREQDADGTPRGYVGAFADVTENKNAQRERDALEEQLRQSQKMEAVGRLAGGVAHDFNNLLTAILGYGHVLEESLESAALQRYAQQITAAARRAGSLTSQLLAFSRKQVLSNQVLDLNAIVADTEDLLRRLIGEQITLKVELASTLGQVRADPNQLGQVLMNLAVNARDAMAGEGGTLTIRTHRGPPARSARNGENGEWSYFSIVDTGCGMDEDTQRHIFEPFFTTKALGRGTGLGLATVYGIVEQSGGTITCTSQVGRGTCFEVGLPCVSEAVAASVVRKLPSGAAPKTILGTILLVEDDDEVRSLARHVLETAGHQVLSARHAEEALTLSHQFQGEIALLVTDVVLPKAPGHELARELKTRRARLAVLYMSGYADHPMFQVQLGDALFLAKPFTPAQLLDHVEIALARSCLPVCASIEGGHA